MPVVVVVVVVVVLVVVVVIKGVEEEEVLLDQEGVILVRSTPRIRDIGSNVISPLLITMQEEEEEGDIIIIILEGLIAEVRSGDGSMGDEGMSLYCSLI